MTGWWFAIGRLRDAGARLEVSMSNLLDLLLAGLATGAIYAIVAVGFTLLWQTSQTINFAQGEFVMLPAFLVLAAMHAGAPFWFAILIGILLSLLLLGLGFKMLLVNPMLRHGVLPLAIATMALAIGIKEAVKQFFSAEASPFPSIVPAGDISFFGHPVSLQSIGVLTLAILAVVGLTAFLNRTSIGHQMQAAAQNPTVARIIDVPVERMILLTFLINAFLVALASLLITPIYLAKFSSGEVLGQAAFIAAIVGGFNQVRGAIAGGLLIGVVDNLAAAYVSTQYRAAVLIRWIVIIPFRPQNPRSRGGAHDMTGAGKYWRVALGAIVIAGLIVVPANFNRYGLFILSQWAVMTIAAMGLNLTLGYAGQVSLAQGAFVGIGAYAAAIMTSQRR
jgi:branched-chain amino acid transport system permease protein